MLQRRIIPCLDVKDGRVVKGVNFVNLQDAGDPVEVARRYDAQEADEVVFLDITASSEQRDIMIETVRKTAEEIFMPLTVGGGIRTTEDMRKILAAGADKISINTAAVDNPRLITEGAEQFGSQCIVVAIDGKKSSDDNWEVYIHGGRTATGLDLLDWVSEVEQRGAGEILLTSMDADGTQDGFDIPMVKRVAETVKIPVIASVGAGSPEDFVEVFKQTKASAALAASVFHYDKYPVPVVRNYCREQGVPVRPPWKGEKNEKIEL